MTRRPKSGARTSARERSAIEWIGATVTIPAYVTGEGEPYRPEALVWMGDDGMILGSTVVKSEELLAVASDSLQHTIEQPMRGKPHAPTQVRVASAELAEVLRAGHPGLQVICAPTPEADEMLALMCEHLSEGGEQSYLSPEIGPDAMASFFTAAAALFRDQPWAMVPDDQSLISVSIESLGVRDAAISVIGQFGQSFGLVVFPDADGYEAYLNAAHAIARGEERRMPPHFFLNFERGAQLADERRKEIAEHQWEVAAPDAYPWLAVVDEGWGARPPTARELTIAEAIARALSGLLVETTAMLAAWDGGEPLSRTLSVSTHHGEIEVALCVRCMQAPAEFDPSRDILAELAALVRDDDEPDADAREPLEAELMRRFAAAPEAQTLGELYASTLVIDLGASELGATIATLDADDLHEILFEIIPRRVSIDASEARGLVEECRAFYRFLEREFALTQAGACLRVLGDDAIDSLEAELSDSSNFGIAKSLVMAGRDAGFDMQSEEGLDTWMRSVEGEPLPSSIFIPGRDASAPSSRQGAKAKKDKRKAARKARKRNRKNS